MMEDNERRANENDAAFICRNCGHAQSADDGDDQYDTQNRIENLRRELKQERDEDSDTESVVSVSFNPIEELPLIHSPFAKQTSARRVPKWQGPRNVAGDRDNRFKWEKPFGGDETENETPAQRIRRLEQTIEEKKQDLDVLGKQYAKAQLENYRLAEEIGAFKGDHYDDLKAENGKLKGENGRVFRENTMLRAQYKRATNGKMKELEEKQALEEKYGAKSRRRQSKPTPSGRK